MLLAKLATENNLTLVEQMNDLMLYRQKDQVMLEGLFQLGLSQQQTWDINKCWIFLGVTSLTNLCAGYGFYILPYVLERHNPLTEFTSLEWPNKGMPLETLLEVYGR